MAEFIMNFDPASTARIARMVTAAPIFAKYSSVAMNQCVKKVAATAGEVPYAPVLTGTLRRGIRGVVSSPFVGRVGVISAVPYARRREYGFDNQTDRLGRHYYKDPIDDSKRAHMMYIHRALLVNRPYIAAQFGITTQLIIREIAA